VGSAGLRAAATTLGSWSFAQLAPAPTLRGVAVRNDDEASAVGESYADTFLLTPSPGWRGPTSSLQFLATAVVQGEDEVVCVGFSGHVARSQMRSPVVLLSDTGQYAPYGGDVRLRIVSGQTPLASQWTRNGTDLPGATKSELVIPQVRPADAATYAARVTLPTSSTPVAVDPYVLRPIPAGRPEIRDPTFTPALPFMPQLAVTQPDGKILVAGAFTVTTARGPLRGLARLNADGSLDDGFRPGEGIPLIQTIEAIHLLPDGRCYVRGNFTTIGGLPRAHLARLLADGTVDPAFQPGPTLASITDSALAPDGRLYVHNGPSPNAAGDILRVGADGARDPSFVIPAIDAIVDVDSQGRFLLIKTVPGTPPLQHDQRLVRYLANGSPDPSYTSSTIIQSPPSSGVAVTPARLTDAGLYYVYRSAGGRFGPITSFGRLAPNGGDDPSYLNPPQSDYPQMTLLEYRHRADGGFWQIRSSDGGKTYRARSYDPSGREETNRYATMPDCSFYWIGPTAPDGSFFAASYPVVDSTRANFYRMRPFFGRIGRLANLSVRAFVASADEPLIAGFVTLGTGGTNAIVRAIGPGLGGFGVGDAMRDPSLKLVRDGLDQFTNDNWNATLAPRFAAVGAFPLVAGSRDAALEAPIAAGNYSAVVVPPAGESGTALVELFEATEAATPTRRFVNVSARPPVTPERPLIVGFSIVGEVPVTILVRGVGPALARLGVTGALPDPTLTLYRNGTALWENAGDRAATENPLDLSPWAAAQRTGAFSISSDDAAMVVTLAPGSYSALVTSAGKASGTALVEVYEVP
ncbi:MAG: hypothetical protein NTV51_17295, partial [Verrucomicrobia bacterium]|nr:hypothetical protein [Verrucomicrobiota bacterium]